MSTLDWTITNDNNLNITTPACGIADIHAEIETDARTECAYTSEENATVLTATCANGIEYETHIEPLENSPGWLQIRTILHNKSADAIAICKAIPLAGRVTSPEKPFEKYYTLGPTMCDVAEVQSLKNDSNINSHMVAGFTYCEGGSALVAGFLTHDESFNTIHFTCDENNTLLLHAEVERDNVEIAQGDSLTLPILLIGAGDGLYSLLSIYGDMVANAMQARKMPNGDPMTGWCSWYGYYGTESASDILEHVDIFSKEPWRGKLKAIQVDDGWNIETKDGPRVWGDWHAGYKFPNGMMAIADTIKEKGMIPGLWLAPFSVEKASSIYKEHPDWLVHDENGEPKEFWTVYGLDLTHPEALDFVYNTFTRVFDEWGFQYVKVDFLIHAIQSGYRHDMQQTRAELFRNGLLQIRRAAKENFILNCGSPLAPAIGICDAMRIGYDVSSRWTAMVDPNGWTVGNCAIKPAAVQTIGRQWMHSRLWQNDPDCVVTRDYGTEPEKKLFGEGEYGLSQEEAEFWVRMVWLSGNMTLLSEIMTELEGPRRDLLQRVFPVNPVPANIADWYVNHDVHIMYAPASENFNTPLRVGIFNLSDETVRLEIPAEKCGIEGRVKGKEWLSNEEIEIENTLDYALPPHAGRVFEIA